MAGDDILRTMSHIGRTVRTLTARKFRAYLLLLTSDDGQATWQAGWASASCFDFLGDAGYQSLFRLLPALSGEIMRLHRLWDWGQ